jgi:hypothetical protein
LLSWCTADGVKEQVETDTNGGGDTTETDGTDVIVPVARGSSAEEEVGTGAIVAMSLGGVVLIAATALLRRRWLTNADDGISGLDSSAAPTDNSPA